MKEVTNRFLEIYEYLKEKKNVSSKVDFAEKLGVSSSTITDITKGRTNPGLNVIRGIVKAFPQIRTEWILTGEGEMLKNWIKGEYTPFFRPSPDDVEEAKQPITPMPKSEKLHPKSDENLHPTLHPTEENCKICDQKERLIEALQGQIRDQQKTIDFMHLALEMLSGERKKQAG